MPRTEKSAILLPSSDGNLKIVNIELLKENVVLFALSAFVGDFVPPRKSILDDRFAPLFVIKLCEFVDLFYIFTVVFDFLITLLLIEV